ncbi:putative zinc finger protein, partial [Orchesella cincta]
KRWWIDNRVEIIMMEMEETPVCDAGATEKCLFCAVPLPPNPEEASQQNVESESCGNINSRKILSSRCSSKGLSKSRSLSRSSSYSEPHENADNEDEPTSDFEPDDHDSNWSNHSTDSEVVKQEPAKMQRKRGPKPKWEPFVTIIRHGNRRKYKCSLCSAVRCDRISLRTHLRSHRRSNGFSCSECGWLLHSRDKTRHYTRHHPGKKPPAYIFSCQKCPARYPQKTALMKHAELHEKSGNSEPCSLCGWLVKIKLMPRHMKIHHSQEDELQEKHSHCPSRLHEEPPETSVLVKQKTAHQTEDSLRRSSENLEPNLFTLSSCESTERLSAGKLSPNCELPGKEDTAGVESTSDFKPDSDDDSSSSSTHSQDSEDEEYKPSPRKRVLKRKTNSLSDPQTIRKRGRPPKQKESSAQLKSSKKKKIRRVSEVSDPSNQSLYTSFRQENYTMFKCSLCSAVRHSRDRMIVHLKYHEKGEGSLCSQCGWLVPPDHMSRHISRHHSLPMWKKKAVPPKNEKIYHAYKCQYVQLAHLKKRLGQTSSPHDPLNEEPCTTCDLCGWLLKTTSLQRHLASSLCAKIVEEQKQGDGHIAYSCDHCQMLYTEIWFLRRHFRTYHADQEEWKVCSQPDCHEKFESKQLLKFHMDKAHPDVQSLNLESDEGDSKCPHCELIFASKMKKDYHIAEKHKSILLTCTTCNITMKDYMCYRKHMEQTSIHATSQSVFCELCGSSFWSDSQLRQHKRQEHFAELGLEPIKCQECGLSLCTNVALKNHIKAVHAKEKNYSCEYCGQTFLRPANFADHMRTFHEGPCYRWKTFSAGEKGEDGVETWLCDFCPGTVTFANLMAIRSHLLKAHYSELKYICEGCNKRFCASLGLHKHRKRFCSKHFFCINDVAKHERRLHKDRYSHRCQKCGKAFKTFGMLTNHRKKCVPVPPSETVADVT